VSFDVARFHAVIDGMGGLQPASKFRVRAFSPVTDTRFFEFVCESANVPGVSVVVKPVRTLGYGVPVDVPLVPSYGEMQLQCMIDNVGNVNECLTRWMQAVVNYNYQPGGINAGLAGGAFPFQVSYPADYVGRLEVHTMSQEGSMNRTVTLHDAWPRAVNHSPLAWSARDQYQTLSVTWSYRSWTSDDMSENVPQDAEGE
jgi:hypothetical protein